VKNSDNTESSRDDYENDITGAITKYSIANGVVTPEPCNNNLLYIFFNFFIYHIISNNYYFLIFNLNNNK